MLLIDSHDLIGKTVGNYRVLRCLGKGGVGAVYLGEHPGIQSRVAIKVLLPGMVTKPDVVSRFLDEAKAANRVGHAGIVRIHDCDQKEGIGVYLVMEFLERRPLDRVLTDGYSFSPVEAAQVILQTASAIAASHAVGIVHRDLKPANLYLVPDPDMPAGVRVKVLDFGIAKLLTDQEGRESAQTSTGMIIGTPLYMSPEQCLDSKGVDARTDIYALGVIAY